MPEQLGWCAACNAPIHMERVAGACTCREGALRALQIDLQKRHAARRPPPPATPRPTGVAAATVAAVPQRQQDLGEILMGEARRDLGLREDFEQFDREVRAGLGVPVRPANQPPGQYTDVNLESIWFREGIENPDGPPPDDSFNIEFDEMPMEVGPRPTGGREATRFRVDRGAPQREPFRSNIEPGFQGGPMQQTGTVRGFAVLREQRLAGLAPGERYFASDPEYVGEFNPAPEQQVTPRAAATNPTSPARRPTVYERLRDDDFLDDD